MSKSRIDLLEKECTRCGTRKPNTLEFYYKKKGKALRAKCRDCQNLIAAEYRKHQRAENPIKPRVVPAEKECICCLVVKPNTVEFFHKKAAWKGRKATLNGKCSDCFSKDAADQRAKRVKPEAKLKATEKQCTGCGELKPNTKEFFYVKAAWKGRRATLMARCCDCHNKIGSAYRNQRKEVDPEGLRAKERAAIRRYRERQKEQDPLRVKVKAQWRRWHLRSHWNMSLEEFEVLLTAQNSLCGICGTSDPGRKGWVIDHCHLTDCIRGILCTQCNTGLGMFKDTAKNLEAAIVYLNKPLGAKVQRSGPKPAPA